MLNIESIRSYLSEEPVRKAWLFGSYARGEERDDSDVDILVEFEKEAKVGLLKHAQILIHLENLLKKKVDLVPIGALYSSLKDRILNEKILIYERS